MGIADVERCIAEPSAQPCDIPKRRPVRMVQWAPPSGGASTLIPDEHEKRHMYAAGLIWDRWYYLQDLDVTIPMTRGVGWSSTSPRKKTSARLSGKRTIGLAVLRPSAHRGKSINCLLQTSLSQCKTSVQ